MAPGRKRAKLGDVLELRASDRFAYLHYLGRHAIYGDAVFVNPTLHSHQTAVTDESFSTGYVAFYPARAAVAQGLVEVVGHMPPPKLPQRFRRAGARLGGRIETWVIEDAAGDIVKARLSEEELQLPIAAIWNHEYLIDRVMEGWDPTQVGRGS